MSREKLVLLLVDDDEDFLTSFRQLLQGTFDNAQLLTETDPVAALRRVETERVDAVIVDFRLPNMSGLELVRRVKKVSPACRTVILTGFPGLFLRELVSRGPSARRATDLCLTKTLRVEELVQALQAFLKGSNPPVSLFPDMDRIR